MAERNAGVALDKRIEFRIGIHVGDIIIEDGDIFGEGVNIAARLENVARKEAPSLSPPLFNSARYRCLIFSQPEPSAAALH
jgi:adenylate cyclase